LLLHPFSEGRSALLGAYGYLDRGSVPTTLRTFVVLATGDIGRLGRLTLKAQGAFAPADSVLSYTGAATLVADNGDELTGTFEGTSTPLSGEADATFHLTITGGSGRFQNASGTMNVLDHGALVSTHGTMSVYYNQFTGRGTLSY
jgi:hypothetical protein